MVRQSQFDYWLPPPGGGYLFALVDRLTRKRVCEFFYTYPICGYIFLQLISHIFSDLLFIAPDRIHIVASAPEISVTIFILKICMSIEYH